MSAAKEKLREAIHQIDEFAMSVIHKRKQQMQEQVAETAASPISAAADDHAGRAAPVGRIDTSSPATAGIQDSHQSTAAADQLHHTDLLPRLLLRSFDESKRSSSDVVTNDSATPPESSPETIFSDVFLRDIVISFVLAGRDTSSSGNL
ncbi:unnamed protein product [Sphagnum troendelagicum]|uniref:Uncharacterized protein n=1 Tax=Sphagnum troendelagicum TaxID=128251 RepID=A0ABP0UE60_9BRYO